MNLVKNSRIGFTGFNGGIGDQIMVSSFPENFYRNYNKKLIDINNLWVFDHNPYVDRNINPDIISTKNSVYVRLSKYGKYNLEGYTEYNKTKLLYKNFESNENLFFSL